MPLRIAEFYVTVKLVLGILHKSNSLVEFLSHLKYVLLKKCCTCTHGNTQTEQCYKLANARFQEN